MKKALLSIMVLALLLCLTGCGKKEENKNNGGDTTTTASAEKKLNCSFSADGDTIRFNFVYDGDKLTKATYTSSERYDTEAEAKKQYESDSKDIVEANKNAGFSGNAQQSSTLVTVTATFTIDKMDDKAKAMYEEVFGPVKDKNYDGTKEYFSGNGYDCK